MPSTTASLATSASCRRLAVASLCPLPLLMLSAPTFPTAPTRLGSGQTGSRSASSFSLTLQFLMAPLAAAFSTALTALALGNALTTSTLTGAAPAFAGMLSTALGHRSPFSSSRSATSLSLERLTRMTPALAAG